MESQNSVIDDVILVIDGMIEVVWSASDQTPSAAEGVVSIPTSGTIYPVPSTHTIMRIQHIPPWDHGTDGWDNRYQWRFEDSTEMRRKLVAPN